MIRWLKPAPAEITDPRELRTRRQAFFSAVGAGDLAALGPMASAHQLFDRSPLFRAVDVLLDQGQDTRLPELADLASLEKGPAVRIWRALCDHIEGRAGALQRLRASTERPGLGRRWRGSGGLWEVYITAPRLGPPEAASGPGPTIVQFWDSPDVPDDVAGCMAAWQAMAGPHHRLFDAADAADYLRDHHGPDAAETFRACPHPAMQSDYFRLGYLAVEGGIYADADSKPLEGMIRRWPSLSGRTVLWFRTHVPWITISNGLIAAAPGTVLLEAAFAEATRRLRSTPAERDLLWLAGPIMLRQVIAQLAASGRLDPILSMTSRLVQDQLFQGFAAAYKRDGRNWRIWRRDWRKT